MRILVLAGLGLFTLLTSARDARAISACGGRSGWSIKSGTKLPKHPTLAYYAQSRRGRFDPKEIHASIAGKSVAVKVTSVAAPPYEVALVEIDSDKTGTLSVSYGEDAPATTYTIDASTTLPKDVKGWTERFHAAFHHSTVHEEEHGLAVRIDRDTPAILFTARWRRDDKAPWQTITMPAENDDGRPTARLGELGCKSNFSVPLLESGIDLELDATLPDRTTRTVKLPTAHVKIAPLPSGEPRSSP
jgi:hypothetical protein